MLQKFTVKHNGEDITDILQDDIINFDYSDEFNLQADSMTMSLNNKDLTYLEAFKTGDEIEFKFWNELNEDLKSGTMQIDSITGNIGASSILNINCLSANSSAESFNTYTVYIRKKVKLDVLLRDNLKKIGYSLDYKFLKNNGQKWDINLKNVSHADITVGEIIKEYAELFDCKIKIFDNRVTFANKNSFKDVIIAKQFVNGQDVMDNLSFDRTFKKYKESQVKWWDPKTKETTEDSKKTKKANLDNDDTKKVMIKKVADKITAQALAETIENQDIVRINFTTLGDPELVAGETVEIVDLATFSGKYLIVSANHVINTTWITELDLVNLF